MRALKTAFVLTILFAAIQLHADPITINLGGGRVTMRPNGGGGQQMTFSGLSIRTTDSANNTALSLSPGAGAFVFTTVYQGEGLFAPLNGANFTMGTTSSGIVSGSINSIRITGATTGATTTTFNMLVTFSAMSFQSCSTRRCVDSAALANFASEPGASLKLSFSLQNSDASSLGALLASTGNHNNVALNGDVTSTPEPATLALFGTGLLVVGLRLTRRREKRE